jgi:hypothetical protein
MPDGLAEGFDKRGEEILDDHTQNFCVRKHTEGARREVDPNGVGQHQPGAKLDHGKVQAAEILGMFSNALEQVAKVGQFGADKYSMGGWQHVQDGEKRYGNARLRHWLKRQQGEGIDPDSSLLHLAHEAWNVLAELELRVRAFSMK